MKIFLKMRDILISVIIPVYNTAPYLERCLTSVVNNTYTNLEIICINDGSTDNSGDILADFASRDERIQVITQKNQGLSDARNAGINRASGDYLYYLDSDDWIHKQAFEYLLSAAKESNADIIVGGFQRITNHDHVTSDSECLYVFDGKVYSPSDYIDNSGCARDVVWGTLYRSSSLMNCRFPSGKNYSEDAVYNTMLISGKNEIRFAILNLPLYYYSVTNPGSITKGVDINHQLANVKWWLQNIDLFEHKNFALVNIYRYLFFYLYESSYCNNPDMGEKNFRLGIKYALPYYMRCKKISLKQHIKILLIIFVPKLYRKIITSRDPSYKNCESSAESKYKSFTLNTWDEV